LKNRKGKPLGVPDLEEEEDDEGNQGKNATKSIPVLTTKKGLFLHNSFVGQRRCKVVRGRE